MIVHIDDDRCGGHRVCCALCPELFELTGDGYATVSSTDVPPEFEAVVRDAVLQCPERAISVR